MLQNVNSQLQTNVKLSPYSLTPPTQDRQTSHPTLTQLSLLRFRKKFVPLPTLKWVIFALSYTILLLFHYYSFIMGKVTSLYGKTTGKIGSIVFSTSGGETIAREYNPNVSNPNTSAQINQRARLKLMSQLSASLAPVIAIPKQGLVSARNAFTKKNFDLSMAENGVAQISYENVQLTNGNLGLPTLEATRAQSSGITVNLADNATDSVSRVVYILYRKTAEQRLQFVSSVIAKAAGANGTFPATLPYTEGDIVLYAYGMRDTSESASAKYGNLQVANALDVARLTAYRTISSEDYQFTETRGATMYADQNELTPVPEGSARVFVTPFGGGTVTGGGVYQIGQNATIVATPNVGYEFAGWRDNTTQQLVSMDASYTFVVQGQTDLVAIFSEIISGPSYTIVAKVGSSSEGEGATVTIGNQTAVQVQVLVPQGDSITVVANPPQEGDYVFDGWYGSTGNKVSNSETYTFVPNSNITIGAKWVQGGL